MRVRLFLVALLLLAGAAFGADKLVLATGAPGGVYRLYGIGLAPFLGATTRETAGSVENIKLALDAIRAQLA